MSDKSKAKPVCKSCLGHGKELLLKSMFLGAGFRQQRCGFCMGTGSASGYPAINPRQAEFRAADAAMRKAVKANPSLRGDFPALGRIAREAMAAA